MANDDRDAILAEIHRLVDEQIAALKGTLPPAEMAQYRKRKERIAELLEVFRTRRQEKIAQVIQSSPREAN